MGTLGRNFEYRQPPIPQHRLGRFKSGTTPIPNGVPVIRDGDPDPTDLRTKVKLAVAGDAPIVGAAGVSTYEVQGPGDGYAGYDTALTRESDIDKAPPATAMQVCHGTEVRLLLQNTVARTFVNRAYSARKMVVDALSTLAVGDLLEPATTPSDANGYWQKGTTDPWARITFINEDAGFVEAQLLF